MTDVDNVTTLITELGQALGLPDLALDQDQQCLLSFDTDFLISLRVDDAGWIFAGFLDEWEPAQEAEINLDLTVFLLSLNLQLGATGQGTIGLDVDAQSLLLIKPIFPLPETAAEIVESLKNFVDSMTWIRQQRDQAIVESGTSPGNPDQPTFQHLLA